MGFVPYPCQYCKYATLTKMGLCAREPCTHPRGPSQNRYRLANDGPTHPKSKRGPNAIPFTVCFSHRSVVISKPNQNRSEKNSAKIL